MSEQGWWSICCCWDGLFLIGIVFPGTIDLPNEYRPNEYRLMLWNPSTRESKLLPQEHFPYQDALYGLGYDSNSDDYKVFKVPLDDVDETKNEIFTLKSGSWRKINGYCSADWDGCDSLAFVQGAFHWVGFLEDGCCNCIQSFDISDEVFGEVPLPDEVSSPLGISNKGVTVLGGELSLSYVHTEETTFHLWVMKEYGVKESWTKLFTMVDTRIPSIVPITPKYMFANGEVLLSCKRSVFRTSSGPHELSNLVWPLVSDDTDEDSIKRVDGFVYMESLISPEVIN